MRREAFLLGLDGQGGCLQRAAIVEVHSNTTALAGDCLTFFTGCVSFLCIFWYFSSKNHDPVSSMCVSSQLSDYGTLPGLKAS